ncbi:MAG: hypothetical protein IJQ81_14395 [Oscillibacter sp.]|nr:hypothetical protein [Oscillibacter sp.]
MMYSIAIDPTLAREAQDVFSGHGIDLGDAVSTFLRKSIREMKSADAMTEEELMAKHMHGLAEIDAGGGVRKTLAELEAMARDE